MSDTAAAMQELGLLDEKRQLQGLSAEEEAYYAQLLAYVGQAPEGGWSPDAQQWDPNAAFDPNAQQQWDPNAQQQWDPNAQQHWDPNAQQHWDPNAQQQWDPNAQQHWDPNAAFDPNAQQQWDPNAAFDPNAQQQWDPNAAFDPNAQQQWDPNAAADPNALQQWDPNAQQQWDPNAQQQWDPNAQQQWDPNAQVFDPNAQPASSGAEHWSAPTDVERSERPEDALPEWPGYAQRPDPSHAWLSEGAAGSASPWAQPAPVEAPLDVAATNAVPDGSASLSVASDIDLPGLEATPEWMKPSPVPNAAPGAQSDGSNADELSFDGFGDAPSATETLGISPLSAPISTPLPDQADLLVRALEKPPAPVPAVAQAVDEDDAMDVSDADIEELSDDDVSFVEEDPVEAAEPAIETPPLPEPSAPSPKRTVRIGGAFKPGGSAAVDALTSTFLAATPAPPLAELPTPSRFASAPEVPSTPPEPSTRTTIESLVPEPSSAPLAIASTDASMDAHDLVIDSADLEISEPDDPPSPPEAAPEFPSVTTSDAGHLEFAAPFAAAATPVDQRALEAGASQGDRLPDTVAAPAHAESFDRQVHTEAVSEPSPPVDIDTEIRADAFSDDVSARRELAAPGHDASSDVAIEIETGELRIDASAEDVPAQADGGAIEAPDASEDVAIAHDAAGAATDLPLELGTQDDSDEIAIELDPQGASAEVAIELEVQDAPVDLAIGLDAPAAAATEPAARDGSAELPIEQEEASASGSDSSDAAAVADAPDAETLELTSEEALPLEDDAEAEAPPPSTATSDAGSWDAIGDTSAEGATPAIDAFVGAVNVPPAQFEHASTAPLAMEDASAELELEVEVPAVAIAAEPTAPGEGALPAEMFEPLVPETIVPEEQLAYVPQPVHGEIELSEDPRVFDPVAVPTEIELHEIPLGDGVSGEVAAFSAQPLEGREGLAELELSGDADAPVPLAAPHDFITSEPSAHQEEIQLEAVSDLAIGTSTLAELANPQGPTEEVELELAGGIDASVASSDLGATPHPGGIAPGAALDELEPVEEIELTGPLAFVPARPAPLDDDAHAPIEEIELTGPLAHAAPTHDVDSAHAPFEEIELTGPLAHTPRTSADDDDDAYAPVEEIELTGPLAYAPPKPATAARIDTLSSDAPPDDDGDGSLLAIELSADDVDGSETIELGAADLAIEDSGSAAPAHSTSSPSVPLPFLGVSVEPVVSDSVEIEVDELSGPIGATAPHAPAPSPLSATPRAEITRFADDRSASSRVGPLHLQSDPPPEQPSEPVETAELELELEDAVADELEPELELELGDVEAEVPEIELQAPELEPEPLPQVVHAPLPRPTEQPPVVLPVDRDERGPAAAVPRFQPQAAVPQAPVPELDFSHAAPGPSSYVAGEHRVILHTSEGHVKRGLVRDVDLLSAEIPLYTQPGQPPEAIAQDRVKAIFFMLSAGQPQPSPDGAKIRITFSDGRQVAGFSRGHRSSAGGFFVVPSDNRTNTARIFVYRPSVQAVFEG